jgi:hypothetical protein
LGQRSVIIQAYNTSYDQILPQSINLQTNNTAILTLPSPISGLAVATRGGRSITNFVPVTGSIYPLTSSWAINAINLKGGTITSSGALINGNLRVNGSAIFFSASYIYLTSSQFIVGDNIITLNANSPVKRFAGLEMNDSGSSAKSSFLWDSLGNYFFISGSTTTNSQNKVIVGPSNNSNLTTNYVAKATAGNTLGDSVIYDNGTNVGIGTTSPATKFEMYGGQMALKLTGATTGSIQFKNSSGTKIQEIRYDDSDGSMTLGGIGSYPIKFITSTTEKVRIAGDGNVGIGTTSPGTSLEVYAIPATSTTLRQMLIINTDFASATGTGFGGSIVFRGRTPGNILRDNAQISAYNEDIGDNGYALGFYTRPSDGGGLQQRLTILRAGNMGIGTTAPAYKLQVSGSIAPVGDNKFPLGNTSNRFSDVFAAQSTIGGLFETGLRTTDLGLCETGTIVSWKVDKCVPCEIEEDELVMGVVKRGKDEPLILGAEPILVTGVVDVGDYIVTSKKKGHGKAIKRGTLFKKDLFGKVIAQALESGVGESYAIKAMIRKM